MELESLEAREVPAALGIDTGIDLDSYSSSQFGDSSELAGAQIKTPSYRSTAARNGFIKTTLIGPSGAISDTTPTFSWYALEGATQYQLNIWDMKTGVPVLREFLNGSATSYTTSSALPNGDYSIAVRAWIDGVSNVWSDSLYFTVFKPHTASLVGPSGTTIGDTPTFTWNAAEGATWYQLYVKNDSSGEIVFNEWLEGKTTHTLTEALADGDYRFWVNTWGKGVYGDWSEAMSFTIAVKPGTATVVAPIGTIANNTPQFVWTEAEGATWYRLYISNAATGEVVFDDWLQDTTTYTPSGPLAAGSYNVWVQTWSNGVYGDWSSKSTFTIENAKPGTSTVIAPSGVTTDDTPTFVWTEATRATWYRLYVSNAATGVVVINDWLQETTTYTPTTALATGDYNVWVQTWSNGVYGDWSSKLSFTIESGELGTSTVIAPTGVTTDNTPSFVWTAAEGATWYYLWVADAATGNVLLDEWVEETTTYTPGNALAAGDYDVWVQTWGNGEYGDWSEELSFTIEAQKPAASTVLGPLGTTTDKTPTFSWTAAEGATWYRLQILNEATREVVIDKWVEGATSYTPSNALAAGTYQIWVQTWGNDVYGDWNSNISYVTIEAAKPETATLIGPRWLTLDRTPTFEWQEAQGATWYQLNIFNLTTGETVLVFDRWFEEATSFTPSTELEYGDYQFTVRTWGDDVYGDWSAPMSFLVL